MRAGRALAPVEFADLVADVCHEGRGRFSGRAEVPYEQSACMRRGNEDWRGALYSHLRVAVALAVENSHNLVRVAFVVQAL